MKLPFTSISWNPSPKTAEKSEMGFKACSSSGDIVEWMPKYKNSAQIIHSSKNNQYNVIQYSPDG